MEIKIIFSVIAVILTFVGYYSYIRDTLRGKTTPHIFTWFIWGLGTAIAYGLQVNAGAGVGSWMTLAVTIACFLIFILGMQNGKKDITKSDIAFFILAIVALGLWLIVKQPIASTILASFTAILSFIPTVRKSWKKPHSETLFTYELNILRHGFGFLSLQQYSIVTWLYPVSWLIINGLFSAVLIIRRNQISK